MQNWKQDSIRFNNIQDATIHCQHCGHSIVVNRKNKVLCNHCGLYTFKNKQVEFKYRLREQMLRSKRNDTKENS